MFLTERFSVSVCIVLTKITSLLILMSKDGSLHREVKINFKLGAQCAFFFPPHFLILVSQRSKCNY